MWGHVNGGGCGGNPPSPHPGGTSHAPVGRLPFCCEVTRGSKSPAEMQQALDAAEDSPGFAAELVQLVPTFKLYRAKYDPFVPLDLLREAYAADELNLAEALLALRELAGMQAQLAPGERAFGFLERND